MTTPATSPQRTPAASDLAAHGAVPALGRGRRILHIATRYLRGGAERNIAHFIDWELSAGFDVELAVGPDSSPSDDLPPIRIHRLRHLIRSVNPVRDVAALLELRSLIRAGGYDIVHTHLSKSGVIGRFAVDRGWAAAIHTVHMASFGPAYSPATSTLFRQAETAAGRRTHAMVFVGEGLRETYVASRIVPADRAFVIRSPIDVEPFTKTRAWSVADRSAARTRFGLEPDRPLVVAIGTLERRKRHAMLLRRVVAELQPSELHLAIAGDGPERTRLTSLARRLGIEDRVHLLGHVDDVVGLLASADGLVHAASEEGVPQVVIQALAAGRPVVATEVHGLREIPDAPVTVVPRNGDGFAIAVARMLLEGKSALPIDAFAPWTCPEVDSAIASFHEQLLSARVCAR